ISEIARIEGASRGIGLNLAHEYLRRVHPVVVTAPVESELQRIRETFKTNYNITARAIAKDLEQPNASQENLRGTRKRIRGGRYSRKPCRPWVLIMKHELELPICEFF